MGMKMRLLRSQRLNKCNKITEPWKLISRFVIKILSFSPIKTQIPFSMLYLDVPTNKVSLAKNQMINIK